MKILKAMLIAVMIASPALALAEEPVWFWFANCGGPKMNLELRLDKKIIYQSSFPLCHAQRSSEYNQGQSKKLHFTFNSPKTIVWEGYRDEDNTTNPNQKIESAIWLAGAEPDALLLGISFVADNTIYMNTIHIAHPTKRDVSKIASGLVLITDIVRGDEQIKKKKTGPTSR